MWLGTDGRTWASDKQDKTIEALVAVAEHALRFKKLHGEDVVISKADGTPEYRITVDRIDA